MEPDESDGNVIPKTKKRNSVIKLSNIPPGTLVKLLFLLDNGDKTSGGNERNRELNVWAAKDAKEAFLSALRDKKCRFTRVEEVLQRRAKHLLDYPFISLSDGTEAADKAVRKPDEDLLTFIQACRYLDVGCHKLGGKAEKVRQKLSITDSEMRGTFFIYAENLRMNRICDGLTPSLVYHLLSLVNKDESLAKIGDTTLDISLETVNKEDGLKEALFFYIIRLLEENDKLNRIYTHKLEELLEKLGNETEDESERSTVLEMSRSLGYYSLECWPVGYCVVFCVTKGRDGAQGEMDKVKAVFETSLGYTVDVVKDPTHQTLVEYTKLLKKQKFRFYDSIIYWFMSHGSETNLKLADGTRCQRKVIIDNFSKLDNFWKKPKIFFMASCRGETTISIKKKGGVRVAVDGLTEGQTSFSLIPEQYCDITAVYYQMDRLVANATLPEQFAFRLPDGGSVYVDRVCRLLERHKGENITQVLERVSNKMHQILFSCTEKFDGEAKQACNFESTFQKTFIVPNKFKPSL